MEELNQEANSEVIVAVTTTVQEKGKRQAIKPLIVAKSDIPDVSAQVLKVAQLKR